MISAKKFLSLIGITITLSACGTLFGTSEDISGYKEPRFQNEPPIELNVNKIDIISEFTPSFTRPNVEHLFPISIEKTAELWGQDRLKAADFSSSKIAEVIIKDASVTEEIEESSQIFEQDKVKYSARLVISVKISDPESMSHASTDVEAWRTLTIPANTDIVKKEEYWNSMVEKLFNDFNERMTSEIYQNLNAFIKNKDIEPTYY
ncbi:MAG: hypothetical protein IKC10_05355 [Alphaproteobacteria bacterium]|nr:hypothetical protein [Alphaproteobacteria bacterium]